ncbi:MAG: Amuc_1101 family PilM-like pilus complex protein [Verrucomicrobiales bacterium]
MAAPSRIQTLSLGSQTFSSASFAVGKSGNLTLDRLAFTAIPGDPSAEAIRSGQTGFVLEELARASEVKLPTRYAVSGQSVFTRFVKLPPMGEGKVDQVVEFEAQQNVPFPISEVIWDYQLFTDPATGDTEVALVAIKADVLNQVNQLVEDAGFLVESVDVAPMALLNAFRHNYPDVTEPCMLIDIGARTSNLVFSEQRRIFARSLPIGGASITTAISKEFQVPFEAAEEKKCRDGFVALGGAYAEHTDPNMAALGRVARSSMTRLHAEIVRTINYYRSTLGGNQPRLAFLCGGGSAMPYTKEFFEEKLNIPVDYFNALRNVAVTERVAEQAGAVTYRLGELVGLALRGASTCPVEIDLEPDTVALRREVKERKPIWITAAACLLAGSAALFAFGKFAEDKAKTKASDVSSQAAALRQLDSRIKNTFATGEEVQKKRAPILRALSERRAWPSLLNSLNSYFASDVIWITDVEPMKGEESAVPSMLGNSPTRTSAAAAPDAGEQDAGATAEDASGDEPKAPANSITNLRIRGLWRGLPDNPNAGQDEIRKIVEKIRQDADSPFVVDTLDLNKKESVDIAGLSPEQYASGFTIRLPLKKPLPLD